MNIEELLVEAMEPVRQSSVKDAMKYSLLASGKRLRPNLLFAVLKGYGIDEAIGSRFACALEMIHTYSLIHDDLPAMDNDDLRRGRPTCHKQFDEATAILAGDGLLTYAFQYAAGAAVPADQCQKAMRILAEMAGPDGMVLGQCLDMEEESGIVDWNALTTIHELKTGCLLSAPLMMGAVLAGQSDEVIAKWHTIGNNIGLAFQVQDDILDVTASAQQLGKSNSDSDNEKVTSVTLLGLEASEKLMNDLYTNSIALMRQLDGFDSSEVETMIENTRHRNK